MPSEESHSPPSPAPDTSIAETDVIPPSPAPDTFIVAIDSASLEPAIIPDPLEQATQDVSASAGKPLSLKRKIAIGLLAGGAAAGGGGIYFNGRVNNSFDKATVAANDRDIAALEKANKDISANTNIRNANYGISIGSFALAAVLWFFPED